MKEIILALVGIGTVILGLRLIWSEICRDIQDDFHYEED